MSFIKFNANPMGNETTDCVVRALSVALNKSWYEIYDDICRFGRTMCDMPNSNVVWKAYLKSIGLKEERVENTCPNCQSVIRFSKEHPQGVYILSTCEYEVANGIRVATGSHVVCVMDGNYLDTGDSGLDVPLSFFYVRN